MGAKGASSDDLVAPSPARVGVVPALHRDELPLVKPRTEVEFQHTGGVDLLGLHARLVRTLLRAARRTASANYELADAPSRRTFTTGGYAGEALVAVGIPIEDDVSVMGVKDMPEGLDLGAIVGCTGSIERVLEVGQCAPRSVAVEVPPQPAPLGGAPLTPPDLLAVAVESHDVPGPSIVRVVASGGLPRTPSEVIEVGLRPGGGVVLVVASRRPRAVFVPAPGGIVAVAELRAGALGVDVVAEGEDGSRYSAQRPCCFAVSLEVASGDVSRADQRHCPRLADARHCRQHVHRACQHHRRGYRSASKNDLAHPLHPPLCGVEDKSEIPRPFM